MNIPRKKLRYSLLLVLFGLAFVLLWPSATAGLLQPVTSVTFETYTYDITGRLTRVTYGNGSFIRYVYDNNGNILSIQTGREEIIFFDGFEP